MRCRSAFARWLCCVNCRAFPIGRSPRCRGAGRTVMSRLARARDRLEQLLGRMRGRKDGDELRRCADPVGRPARRRADGGRSRGSRRPCGALCRLQGAPERRIALRDALVRELPRFTAPDALRQELVRSAREAPKAHERATRPMSRGWGLALAASLAIVAVGSWQLATARANAASVAPRQCWRVTFAR
jgi:hypothetical protein